MAECKDCIKNVTCIERRYFGGSQKNCDKFIDLNKYVEVVRCRDCGYWKYVEDGYGECSHPRFHLDGHPDPTMEMSGFCSCGERREENA